MNVRIRSPRQLGLTPAYVRRMPWALAMGARSNISLCECAKRTVSTKQAYKTSSLARLTGPSVRGAPTSMILGSDSAELAVVPRRFRCGSTISRSPPSASQAHRWGESPGGASATLATTCVKQPPCSPFLSGRDGMGCAERALATACMYACNFYVSRLLWNFTARIRLKLKLKFVSGKL